MTEDEKIANLMKPRFKVIADYPNNPYPVGTTLTKIDGIQIYTDGSRGMSITDLETYPNIFKSCGWYEDRSVDEMPGFVKTDRSILKDGQTIVLKIDKYDFENNFIQAFGFNRMTLDIILKTHLPATESDYILYNQQSKS